MKLVLDEKFKHRLIGLAVILSLGFILAPAVMRKSNQAVDDHFNVQVKLPTKPIAPDVVVSNEETVFKTIKVAKVDLPPPVSNKRQVAAVVKAQPLQAEAITVVKVPPVPKMQPQVAVKQPAQSPKAPLYKIQLPKKKTASQPLNSVPVAAASTNQGMYAVQLASFAKLSNAEALVGRLQSKGYKANLIKVAGRRGPLYKVYAGHSPRRNEVLKLQTQLAAAMQLNGFIVSTKVS